MERRDRPADAVRPTPGGLARPTPGGLAQTLDILTTSALVRPIQVRSVPWLFLIVLFSITL